MKVETTTNSQAPITQLLLSRTSPGGKEAERKQDPGKDKTVDGRCISELVRRRRGQAVEIQDICSF